MQKTVVIQDAPAGNGIASSFDPDTLDGTIWQNGYDVIHEKCLECPCKSFRVDQLSTCKNCGGTGWIFINPVKTRMVLHSMNENTQFKSWSKEIEGQVNISTLNKDRLTYMDRITVINSEANYNQVSHIRKSEDNSNKLFTYLDYHVKTILYVALYVAADQKLRRLEVGEYSVDGNKFFLSESFLSNYTDENTYSITITYIHQPQYHVIGFPRHVANSKISFNNKETIIDLPLSAIGRVSHFVLDVENIKHSRLLDNSYQDTDCDKIIQKVDSFTKMC